MRAKAPGGKAEAKEGWLVVPRRRWKGGDKVTVTFPIPVRLILGDHTNRDRAAIQYGPVVLAYDAARTPAGPSPRALGLTNRSAQELRAHNVEGLPLAFEASAVDAEGKPAQVTLTPFAEAGSTGGLYQVWLRAPGVTPTRNESLFAFGEESRSRVGNVGGEISDGDPGTYVVTFDATRQEEDWFMVRHATPVSLRRVVFTHGRTFHDGGWFDASLGKPRVEVQREKDGPWVAVGTLEEYPATTATDSRNLKDGQGFTLRLREPVRAVAVRVIGKPASGDNPQQAFTSCAELQAFAE
jgi:hypothetical protein